MVITVILLQIAVKFSIVVDYVMNKEYIAKTLCENKAKPMMHCNGKCHLKKQLEKQEKKEKPVSNAAKEKCELHYFSDIKIEIYLAPLFFVSKDFHTTYKPSFSSKIALSVFHPPQV